MKTRLVIDGNAVYEIDEECEACLNGERQLFEEKQIWEKVRDGNTKRQDAEGKQ